jgi:transcriptional regulator with XRE-family HTH domain
LKDLAAKTQLSVPYLSDLERRPGTNPTLDTLKVIAGALDCDVRDLLGGEELATTSERLLPLTLQRFMKTEDFSRRVAKIANRANRSDSELREEIINFLAMAPKRASGELAAEDWRRLLDMYALMLDE